MFFLILIKLELKKKHDNYYDIKKLMNLFSLAFE